MLVRFWGTRGSIAKPGPNTLRYGGNTCCVEVRASDGTLLVLDAGTGAYDLGRELTAQGSRPASGHLLIGHTHWDHIQGFPFFAPLFQEGGRWEIYAPGGRRRQLENTLAGQMDYEYFPINLDDLDAEVHLHDLGEGAFDAGGVRVTTRYMNHPALTLGYRIEADGAAVVYATDHEPHSLHPHGAAPGALPVHHEDSRHVDFLEGADLLIHDAQFTLEEFPERRGWGHSPVERVVDYAIAARARRVALYHHDPDRTDAELDEICAKARKLAARGPVTPEIFMATEGQEIELRGAAARPQPLIVRKTSALLSDAPRPVPSVLIVDDDPDLVALLETALCAEGARVLTAGDGESALAVARDERLSLVLLDLELPGLNGMDVCRALRAERDERLRNLPILILTGAKLNEADLVDAFVAGATDYLTKPVKPTLIRTRVRSWLERTS
jgi:CheY-like chemotaxis protein